MDKNAKGGQKAMLYLVFVRDIASLTIIIAVCHGIIENRTTESFVSWALGSIALFGFGMAIVAMFIVFRDFLLHKEGDLPKNS